jgi:PucR-like helix-turn-helix protein/diguanylate cyclase with GGDEF domain
MLGLPEGGLVGEASARTERDRIIGALLAELDALTARGTEAIQRRIPAYADCDERFIADVRDQVRRHYGAQLAALLEDRELVPADIAFTRGAAMRRARRGFAVEDYINAFRVGMEVIWDEVSRRAAPTLAGREAALALARPLMHYANFAATHAGNAYVEYQQFVVADADRARRDLLEHLLAGRLPERGPLRATAHGYGLRQDARAIVAVAVPADPESGDEVPTSASAVLARVRLGEQKTLVVARQSEIVAVPVMRAGRDAAAVCDALEAMQARLAEEGMPLAMGISTPADGVAELPRAYAEARAALAGVTDEGVAALPRLTPFAYLARSADATAHRLVDDRLRAFLQDDRGRGGVLTATVRAFAAADLNLRVTAEALQIHPNTAQYRINRIEERTGRSLRRIDDLVAILMAIELDVGA